VSRLVGSGRGRAMRRCSFAGPPPMVVDVLVWWVLVILWVSFCECTGEPGLSSQWSCEQMQLYGCSSQAKINPMDDY